MKQIQIFPSITTIDSHSLKSYLNEVSRIPCLTPEEEANLASLIREGGKEGRQAKERLVVANLRFVISIAKMYQHAGMLLEDLINEGNIGLIKAADCFDPTLGFKFITYAVWHIRRSILYAISEKGKIVRLPHNKQNALRKIKNANEKFEQNYKRKPTVSELSEIVLETEDTIKTALESNQWSLSIDAPLKEGCDICICDLLYAPKESSADRIVDKESLDIDLRTLLASTLTSKERDIIFYLFGIGCKAHNLEEVSSKTGLSKEGVRQIRERALLKMRLEARTNQLRQYL